MSGYVKEEEIRTRIEHIQANMSELESSVNNFTVSVNNIEDLLVGLKLCLKTTSGVERIKNIANIDFDTVKLNTMLSEIKKIDVEYSKERVKID